MRQRILTVSQTWGVEHIVSMVQGCGGFAQRLVVTSQIQGIVHWSLRLHGGAITQVPLLVSQICSLGH